MKYILTQEEAEFRGRILSDVKYSLLLSLSSDSTYSGSLFLSFSISSLEPLWLDFKGQSLSTLVINTNPQELLYEDCRVYLPGLSLGPNTVQVHFQSIYSTDGAGLHCIQDPLDNEIYLYTQFEPFAANRVFPCFDQPDIKGVFELTVAAPDYWKVISNSASSSVRALEDQDREEYLVKSGEIPMRVHRFKPTVRISTYVYALCAGPYAEFRVDAEVPMGFYCRKSMERFLNPEIYTEWTLKGFAFYNEFFDFKYPFEKYDQVFVPEFNFVAMENVGCVVYDEKFLFSEGVSQTNLLRACYIFLHEMSHMWFGNLVTMKWWNDLWLNESFATFISCLCISKQLSDTFPEIWTYFCKQQRNGLFEDQLLTTHPISCTVRNTIEIFSFFDGISYEKGSSVLKQLFFILGEENFKQSIQKYFKKFQYSNATFSDLISIMSEFSLETNLHEWAEVWIKQAGVNKLVPEILLTEDTSSTSLKIIQTSVLEEFPTLRPHQILINIYRNDLELTSSTRVTVNAVTETTVELPVRGFVLLNGQNHSFCKLGLDDASLNIFLRDLKCLDSSVSRLQIYGALWDMVMEGNFSLRIYIDFAKKNIISEDQPYNYLFLVRTVRKGLAYLRNRSLLEEVSHQIFEILIEKLKTTPENQAFAMKKSMISNLFNEQDIRQAVSWFDSGVVQLNQTLRWKILEKYAAVSEEAKALVEQEHQQDKSHAGNLHKIYCEAAYPNREMKAQTWNTILHEGEKLPKFQRIQMMKGFNIPHQAPIISEFSGYFDEVIRLSTHSDLEYSIDFTKKMLPRYRDTTEIIAKIQETIGKIPEERNDMIIALRQKGFILSRRMVRE